MKPINKTKVKSFVAGLLVSVATWWLIVDIKDRILTISPIQNTLFLSGILYLIAYYLTK